MYYLADTSYLTESPYALWGVIMVVVLLGLACYNAWQDDADERRKGYYVLACALVLGVLILLGLHIWQVDPLDILCTHRYFSFRRGLVEYNYMLMLALGWVIISWFIGGRLHDHFHLGDDKEDMGGN